LYYDIIKEKYKENIMYKIGLSSCGFELTEENFSKLQASKINAIEISMSTSKYDYIDYKSLKELSKKYEIDLWSYHLPFYPFDTINIASLDNNVRKNTIEYLTGFIKKGSEIGFNKFIIHPSGEPNADNEREEKLKYSMESLDKLAEIAHKEGALIAVQDLPRSCLGNSADEILKLISVNDKLKICFDTNHLLQDNNINFLDKCSDKIITVHVSDYDFINERHWLPGEGKINWQEFFEKFKQINYNGVWMYEISLSAERTMKRNRSLTFEDFYINANNIFNGDNPLKNIQNLTREYLV
jgi:sugar phosphate isomerase/epimerase